MSRKLLLLVEDDDDIRWNLKEVLQLEGYPIIVAPDGRAALRLLDTLKPAAMPSLILLDLLMPVMTGWEFLEAQQADPRIADIPVIALSAAGEKAKSANAQAFIKKPIDVEDLIRLIELYARRA
jgi:CheY-like chemotaxis protein